MQITGEFPHARYFSLSLYNDNTGDVIGGADDYKIVPDKGFKNPFAVTTTQSSRFTVYVVPASATESQIKALDCGNVIKIPDGVEKAALCVCHYLGEDGHGNAHEFGGVELPAIKAYNINTDRQVDCPERVKSNISSLQGRVFELKSDDFKEMPFYLSPESRYYPNNSTKYLYARTRLLADEVCFTASASAINASSISSGVMLSTSESRSRIFRTHSKTRFHNISSKSTPKKFLLLHSHQSLINYLSNLSNMNHTFSTFAAAMLISILFITSCNSAQEQQRATLIKSSDNRELPLPSRDPEAIVGSEFIKSLGKVTFEQGAQDEIVSQILSGNIPDILRKFRTIRYFQKDADSVMHKVEIEILTDYLAIGSNEDFIRMPMGPIAAQKLADSLRCTLPTTFLVDKIAEASEGGIEPFPFWPYGIRNSYPGTYDDSNRAINALYRANGYHAGQLISGLKKDIVISSETYKDSSRLDRLAIYGWHYPDGRHIQDLHYKHGDFYVDYSHGVRLIYRICLVDGVEHDIEDLLKDEVMYRVVSLEPITQYTYRR